MIRLQTPSVCGVHTLSRINQDNIPKDGLCYLSQLLEEMMPEWEIARKMEQ